MLYGGIGEGFIGICSVLGEVSMPRDCVVPYASRGWHMIYQTRYATCGHAWWRLCWSLVRSVYVPRRSLPTSKPCAPTFEPDIGR
jgi:hypothetical protein